jgi:hypothetical protein
MREEKIQPQALPGVVFKRQFLLKNGIKLGQYVILRCVVTVENLLG